MEDKLPPPSEILSGVRGGVSKSDTKEVLKISLGAEVTEDRG